MKIYGYCRISTAKQSLKRQIENIIREYPTADIRKEVYTGTKSNRPEWDKLLKIIKQGDTIVFDSVSRMSRNAEEGFTTYMKLYNEGVNLVFLKEQTINTDSFKSVLGSNKFAVSIETADEDANKLINGIMNEVTVYITRLAEKQIKLAFEQSEKEVKDLQERTSEGMKVKGAGEKISLARKGNKYETKKSKLAKDLILKHHKQFGNGMLNDVSCMALINGTIGIAKGSYYKYKRELAASIEAECTVL